MFRSVLRPEDFILWNNKHFTIAGKSAYWKDWHTQVGIERIKDLLDENNSFLGFEQFCRKTTLYYILLVYLSYTIQMEMFFKVECLWKQSPEREDKRFWLPRPKVSRYSQIVDLKKISRTISKL